MLRCHVAVVTVGLSLYRYNMHVCIYFTCMYTYIYTYIHACIYTYTCTNTCVYIYIYIYTASEFCVGVCMSDKLEPHVDVGLGVGVVIAHLLKWQVQPPLSDTAPLN